MPADGRMILPTYDASHYSRLAARFFRNAEHEPDPALRTAMLACARECGRLAGRPAHAPAMQQHALATFERRDLEVGGAPAENDDRRF